MIRKLALVSVLATAVALVACSKKQAEATALPAADLIITGGPIVTMEGDQPTLVVSPAAAPTTAVLTVSAPTGEVQR